MKSAPYKYFLFFIIISIAFGCHLTNDSKESKPNNNVISASELVKLQIQGQNIYKNNCQNCHGNINAKDVWVGDFWNLAPGASEAERFKFYKNYLANSDSMANVDPLIKDMQGRYNTGFSHKFKFTDIEVIALRSYFLKNISKW